MFDDDSDKMLGKYGAMNPMYGGQGGGDAAEASKVNEQFNSAYAKRDFSGKSHERKSFWGKKGYASKGYDGGTDASRFREGAREGGLWAQEGALVSNETGRSYDRGRDFGGSAAEGSRSPLSRPSDAEVDEDDLSPGELNLDSPSLMPAIIPTWKRSGPEAGTLASAWSRLLLSVFRRFFRI